MGGSILISNTMIKVTVRHAGREVSLEALLPEVYVGYTQEIKVSNHAMHMSAIKDIVKTIVEQVIKLNE